MGTMSISSGETLELITGDRTYNMVDGRFDLSKDIAEEAYAKAIDWLERLLTVDLLQSGIGELINYWIANPTLTYTWQNNPLLNVVPPDAPAAPILQTITMPTLPDDPSEYQSTQERYSSDLVTALLAQLISDISTGSTGLSTTAEADLYARAKARRELENEQKVAKAIASNASLGWSKPPGSLAAQLRSIETEIYRDTQMMNYEIVINQAEWIQKNKALAYQTAAAIENSLMAYHLNSEETGVRVYLAGIEAFKAKIQGILGRVEAQVAYNKGNVDVYSEMSKARALMYNIFAQGVELEIKQSLADTDVKIKELDARIKALTETYGVNKEVVKAGAQIAAQVCAAALGSVNVGAALQYQEQRSDSTSQQTGYEKRESESISVENIYQHSD